jgi:hypothetical protein
MCDDMRKLEEIRVQSKDGMIEVIFLKQYRKLEELKGMQ